MKRNLFGRGLVILAIGVAAIPAVLVTANASPPRYRIEWTACPGSTTAQCGTLRVPLDWATPQGSTIDVAVARRPADDPGRRIGTLYFNPGGPGDGAVKYVIAADTFFSATLRARFDIVGVDPRGIAGSTPLRCSVPALTPTSTFFPRTRAQFVQLRVRNAAVARGCLRTSGAQVRHMDTMSVARDHEALRIALGVQKVSWLGLSYGTQLGIDYASLFPEHTRALVLDAALEHSASEVSQTADAIQTVESAFNRFARWCDTSTDCALHGQDVGAVFDRLVVRANRHPIPVDGALRPVTGDDILMGMPNLLVLKDPNVIGGELSWPVASQALAGAVAGQAGAFALPPFQGPTDLLFGIGANGCGDYAVRIRTWADMQQRIAMGRTLAPHLQGASENWRLVLCIGRNIAVANPARMLDVAGVPALIVHSTHDPSVSYKWAYGLADQIRDSVVLTRRGDGHTSYYGSVCARTAMDSYLVRPVAPATRVCAA
jgi:pimeloyl-ACP methyl ester carboxylesterase